MLEAIKEWIKENKVGLSIMVGSCLACALTALLSGFCGPKK
jgi:hypothetical protein